MAAHQKISELHTSDKIDSIYLIREASLESSPRAGDYWKLQLSDATGSLPATIWSPKYGKEGEEEKWQRTCSELKQRGNPAWAHIQGMVGEFRGMQINVSSLSVLDSADADRLDLSVYVASSSRSGEDMLKDMEKLCSEVLTYKPWKKFVRSVLFHSEIKQRLLKAPAAKMMHHARAGGLLEHSLSVARLCMRIADHYPELDRQTLLAAALLHDIGKLDEMTGPLGTEYTSEGNLLGHIVQGLIILEPFLKKSELEDDLQMHFRHLIASHHGHLEFGAIKEPKTPEAFALHFADDLDAKIDHCREVLPAAASETQWYSNRGDLLCRPLSTPQTPSLEKKHHGGQELQGSLV